MSKSSIEIDYARLESPAFLGKTGGQIGPELNSVAVNGNKAVNMQLEDGLVTCTVKSTIKDEIVFLVPVSQFKLLIPKKKV